MKTALFGLFAALLIFAFSPCAMAQQSSGGAVLLTTGAPQQVILNKLPRITSPATAAGGEPLSRPTGAGLKTPQVGGQFAGLGTWCFGSAKPNAALAVGPTFVL